MTPSTNDERTQIRYGAVLLLLACTFSFAMIAPPVRWAQVVSALLTGSAAMVALARAQARRRVLGLGLAAVAVAVAATVWASFGGRLATGIASLSGAGLLLLIPVAIVVEFRRNLEVTMQSVLAVLCVYVVLGMLFATLAAAVGDLGGRPYFANLQTATTADYTYFSFVTLATVGYGDLVPVTQLGRVLAVLEGLSGQIYLVTVVALVVGNVGRTRTG
jgi:voltage-gated potassium channel Kch